MEVSEAFCQQDRLQLIAVSPQTEKRKWQTEIENKKRQLEDDRRALQHLKSKALRERWLLDGAPSAGPDQDEVKRQLEQDEAKTRNLEETISRLEQELVSLETGTVCESVPHTTVSSRTFKAVEVIGHGSRQQDRAAPSGQVVQVVHEMNGEDGIHLLSSSEVDELIHKADEASMMSQTVATVTSLPTAVVQDEAPPRVAVEITGLEAKPGGEPSVTEASAENPVTMVFMGYQSVEDEDETKKMLGLQGTVKAELVLIEDNNGKTSPGGGGKEEAVSVQTGAPPPASTASVTSLPTTKPLEVTVASNGERAGEAEGKAVAIRKEKQPCKCCSIM
ncbi:paralemmin 1a isoform X4 [Mastacembelus armatus]|uniref:paralemmin 1a isoform X4 n=1 Tax=Mastacembelus armatus TaxID=205130 RepID=UPI000E457936|nr:paralemmin-1 isoform X4 [Mastacembelus armatus]